MKLFIYTGVISTPTIITAETRDSADKLFLSINSLYLENGSELDLQYASVNEIPLTGKEEVLYS